MSQQLKVAGTLTQQYTNNDQSFSPSFSLSHSEQIHLFSDPIGLQSHSAKVNPFPCAVRLNKTENKCDRTYATGGRELLTGVRRIETDCTCLAV